MSRLSNLVLTAARSVKTWQRIGTKVWLDDVHAELCQQLDSRINLDRFKQAIVDDLDCRLLLGTCDMPGAYSPSKVNRAEVNYFGIAKFHFVRIPLDDAEFIRIARDWRSIAK